MTVTTTPRPSVRAALGGLVDYAGLFPPAELTLADARSEYEAARHGPYAWILGRFIIPAGSLDDPLGAADMGLSVIARSDPETLNAVAGSRRKGRRIEALEIPLDPNVARSRESISRDEILDIIGAIESDLTTEGLRAIPAFVEIPRAPVWQRALGDTMDALARFNLGAKIRCGGLVAAAFPSVEEVAEFISTACSGSVPFKATAGLHHPVRHRDAASGFTMHGFLNMIAAMALAPRVDQATVAAVIAEEDVDAFAFDDTSFTWRDERIEVSELVLTRTKGFVSYGSCSFSEPVEDLIALGLLAPV